MKTFLRKKTCPHCQHSYDPILKGCPKCGESNPEFARGYPFEWHVIDSLPWQIGYFLFGWAGFQVLGLIISLLIDVGFVIANPNATAEETSAFLNGVGVSFGTTAAAYCVMLVVFIVVLSLRKRMHVLAKSFRHWLPYVAGICGGALLLGISILYSLFADWIMTTAHITASVNENESAIRAMATAFPVLSIFVFGLVGPFCEEVTYRVGLFGFSSRFGKVLAYVISATVFGLIHFSWRVLFSGDGNAIAIEFINLPNYLIAGIGLALLYDKCGFCASFIAHAVNNLVSIITSLASGGGNA